MSKGNMLLGHARGKVGSLVFSRLKGQQVTRARNFSPANPRTSSQMYQRALFTDAVKFYTRGRRNLFQFAFEDKKPNESDYNAFMRENAKRGVLISQTAFNNYGYPALGNWVMSKGTLSPSGALLGINTGIYMEIVRPAEAKPTLTTVGQLSQQIIDGIDYLNGDILTFVNIRVADATGIPNVDGNGGPTLWQIDQIQLDTTSAQPLSDFNIEATAGDVVGGTTTIVLGAGYTAQATDIQAGCIIHSRNTATGTRVSTEELTFNTLGNTAIDNARKREYVDAVVESWRTTQKAPVVSEAVMQGSIAQSIALDFDAGE